MNDIDLLKSSSYFDPAFYLQRYPDAAGVDPYQHYIEHGGLNERWPSEHFDPAAYSNAYPEVKASGTIPLIHFLREGIKAQLWAGLVPQISHGSDCTALLNGEIADIALVKGSKFFDAQWYSKMHQDLEGLAPAEHYVRRGAGLGWSPSQAFDGPAYSRLYPDIGRMNPLLHYLRNGRYEGRALGMTAATKALIERELSALAKIEPDLMADDRLHRGLERLPMVLSIPATNASECWRRLWARVGPHTEHLVLVPWLVRGGADLAAVNVVKALQEQSGVERVVIVATDHATVSSSDWLPQGTRLVVLAEDELGLSIDDRRTLIEKLIWTLRPRSVVNVNSLAGWEAVTRTGRALTQMTELNALLFCVDYTADGRAAGYSDTHFRAALPYLNRVYFDTRYFIEELKTQYRLPPTLAAKLHYLPQPSSSGRSFVPHSRAGKRSRIVWAGRFAAQKNIELLMKIVENGTSFDFDVWGSGQPEIEQQLLQLAERCGNLHLKGPFASLNELPFEEYAAFLFTSHYEGMPTIILNIAAMGLPIVATAVGGVGEVVNDRTGWPILDRHDARPYLLALSEIVSDVGTANTKIAAMQDQLETSRSWQKFKEELFR